MQVRRDPGESRLIHIYPRSKGRGQTVIPPQISLHRGF